MAAWLSKVVEAMGGSSSDGELNEVHKTLDATRRNRTKLQIEPMGPLGPEHEPVVLYSTIEQVRPKDFIIAQPTIGGITRPLATGEPLRVSFSAVPLPLAAQTRSLGRIKIPSGGRQALFGYRLAVPDRLDTDERRASNRVSVGVELAPQVQLLADPKSHIPAIHGVVDDLSIGGLRMRTRDDTHRLTVNHSIRAEIHLPDPVGVVTVQAVIAHVGPGQQLGEHVVGLRFEGEVANLAELVRSLEGRHMTGR